MYIIGVNLLIFIKLITQLCYKLKNKQLSNEFFSKIVFKGSFSKIKFRNLKSLS